MLDDKRMSLTPSEKQNIMRQIPSVDRVLRDCAWLISEWGHQIVSETIRTVLDELRVSDVATTPEAFSVSAIHDTVKKILDERHKGGIQPVLNLTGVVLHTNLGRACLPDAAARAVENISRLPNNLEYDLATGKRGNRDSHIESLICELTGAEAATVVNNNAAAVVIALNAMAKGKEVPVSRGELVEIGGSFRMPEVMAASGCILVEVGATNRTHLKDYKAAISEQTALLMKVHTSNYRVEGFTDAVDEKTLSDLAHEYGLPCLVDLGSGCLVDLKQYGLPDEPKASDYIGNGIDLLTFSGDKLLGGPQCGIIAGRSALIEKINNNPLKRAMRVDSMTMAALAAVLKLYRHPEKLAESLPTLRQLSRNNDDIQAQATRLINDVSANLSEHYHASVQPCKSQIGSGALPVETIPSFAIVIKSTAGKDSELRQLGNALRQLPVPVIGRHHNGEFVLDLRCLEDEAIFLKQLPQLRVLLASI